MEGVEHPRTVCDRDPLQQRHHSAYTQVRRAVHDGLGMLSVAVCVGSNPVGAP